MDSNVIVLILFAVMMLFCCGGVGRLFSRRDGSSHCGRRDKHDDATRFSAGK